MAGQGRQPHQCKYIIASKPPDAPVTVRANPVTIFDAEEPVKIKLRPTLIWQTSHCKGYGCFGAKHWVYLPTP
eukprot:7268134-Prymnesium_polylepis.2